MWEVREVVKDRPVPVPDSLTEPVPAATLPEGDVDTLALGAAYKASETALAVCNMRLMEIRSLAPGGDEE